MRMWMVPSRILCRKHLLGEHGEIHKHRHNFVKKHKMDGRIGQIQPRSMKERHDELAVEMLRRGYNHQSPYEQPDISYLPPMPDVDILVSWLDLSKRCPDCAERAARQSGLYDIFKNLLDITYVKIFP